MGNSTTEIELKLLLPSSDAHDHVRALLDPSGAARVVRQENAFLDTPQLDLRAAGFSLRVRTTRSVAPSSSGVTHTLTLKGKGRAPTDGENPLSVRPELERAIDDGERALLAAGAADPFAFFDDQAPEARRLIENARAALAGRPFGVVGQFSNTRTHLPVTIPLPSGEAAHVVELDQTDFGTADIAYEVELEVRETGDAEPALRWLEQVLASLGIVGVPAPGKASRFFASLGLGGPRRLSGDGEAR